MSDAVWGCGSSNVLLFVREAEDRTLSDESGLWVNVGQLLHPSETQVFLNKVGTKSPLGCGEPNGGECVNVLYPIRV